jgi:hypothetical protein
MPQDVIDENIFEIQPTFSLPSYCHDSYSSVIQQILETILTEWLTAHRKSSPWQKDTNAFFSYIQKQLPIVHIAPIDETANSTPITFLCPAEFTHGVGRYITDTFSRWLIPGRQLPLVGQITLNFKFTHYPTAKFYIIQEVIGSSNFQELITIHKNLPHLVNEMKINIMAVYHARYITSLRSYSLTHKNLLIQENLYSLLNNTESSPYDQLQVFITKLSSEEKIHQVTQNLTHLLKSRPRAFDRDTFYEIRQHINIFTQEFLSKRDQKHLSRIIAYQYLFKKVLQEKVKKAPLERHLSIKVIHCNLKEKEPIASILVGMNFLKETERFEYRHLQEAIKNCLPSALFVEDSFLIDRRHEKILFLYVEIYKPENQLFTTQEIKHLRQELPVKLTRHIETVAHSIFMPRNEEELLRNIIILSNQIKYIRDLPQLSIHYEKQTDTHLFFTVILVRLKNEKTAPLNEIFEKLQESIKIDIDEIRIAGFLKKKYPKEAAILHASVEKEPFFRSDYSVDLLKARQKVFYELTSSLGEFRDFNGGMIIQQDLAFSQLRQKIEALTPHSELLLENYFYSIRPAMMQAICDSSILKAHFEILLQTTETRLAHQAYLIHQKREGNFHLYWIQAAAPTFKDEIIQAIRSNEWTHSFLQIDQYSMLGFILRIDSEEMVQNFQNTITKALDTWAKAFVCPLKS